MPPIVSIPLQSHAIMKELKQSSETMDRLGYQDLVLKSVQNGLSEGGKSKSTFQFQRKAEPVVGTGRFLENSMNDSRQDTSGAAEGPLAEPNPGDMVVSGKDGTVVEERGSQSVPTLKRVGTGIMQGRTLQTEDFKIDDFPRPVLKTREMDNEAHQSPVLSFRSLLEGAISASQAQRTNSAQGIAESGLQYDGLVTSRATPESHRERMVLSSERMLELRKGERNITKRADESISRSEDTLGASIPHVSYSSLLQAQLGSDPVEVRADPSCKTAGTLRLNVGTHSPPVQLQLHPTKVEGGFLALLNETTRLLAPVAQRSSSPRAYSVSNGGRISGVRFSDQLLQSVSGDASRSADTVLERDGSDLPRASAVPAPAVLPRAVGDDGPQAEAVVERRSSRVADSTCSDEDASVTPLPEERGGPFAANESLSAEILSDGVAIDFSETAKDPASPGLTKTEEDVSPADFVVTDAGSMVDEMTDAQLLEELSRGLAIEESSFAENASNMGDVDSSEAVTAALTSPVLTRTQQRVSREEAAVAGCVYIDGKALDAELSEEPSGPFGANESRSARKVSKRNIVDSLEACAAPDVHVSGEVALPGGVGRTSFAVPGLISSAETASRVQPTEEVPQALTLEESRCAESVPERDALDSSGAAAAAVSLVVARREEDVGRVEIAGSGSMDNDEEMAGVFQSEEPSEAVGVDELRNTEILKEEIAATVSEAAAEAASLVPIRRRDDVRLPEALMEKEVGLCGDTVVHSERGKDHPVSCIRSDVKVSYETTQYLSRGLETGKPCAGGLDGVTDAGITLVSSWQAGLKQLDDGGDDSVGAETILEWSCKAGSKEMEDVDRDGVELRGDNLCKGASAGTVVQRSREIVPKQTDLQNISFVDKTGEISDAYMPSSTENVSLESKEDVDLMKVVLEKELHISECGPGHLLHTELVKDDLNVKVSVEESSSFLPLRNGHMERVKRHFSSEQWGSISSCAEGRSEPLDAGSVVGSSWQAGLKHRRDGEGMAGRDQEDIICRTEVLEDLMGQHAGSTEEHSMDNESGAPVETPSISALLHVGGNLLIAEYICTDGGDHAVSGIEEKAEQDRNLGGGEGLNGIIERPSVERHKFDSLADELAEKQMALVPYSESQALKQGRAASRTNYESDGLPLLELVAVDPDYRNEEERVPEGHIGEIVNIVTDSGNAGIPADQVLKTSPDAVSDDQKQVDSRYSDATGSESLESVQVSGAESGAAHKEMGKELQSPLGMKSNDRYSQDAGDLENKNANHPEDLEENEELSYASPLNGTVNDHLMGAEVRSFKKKSRPRAYNLEKALHETGRSHFQPSGSKRKRHLQYPGNRWRRHRHIDPDQPVPVYIEGRDEVFEEADDAAFSRWLVHQDKGNTAPSPSTRKRVCKHCPELLKPVIAIPSFRVVTDYEERQREVETRRKVEMQQRVPLSTHETFMSSRAVGTSEYDMDDEDERWLHKWNNRLTRGGLKQPISEDKFEEMIEYFERLCAQMEFDPAGDFPGFLDYQKALTHSVPGGSLRSTSPSGLGYLSAIPATPDVVIRKSSEAALQKSFKLPAEQHASDDCCICNGGEDDETNPVYTCKRCSIHVHQSCYGIREKFRDDEGRVIAPSSWCCRKCEAVVVGMAQPNVSCVLCRKRGGALKPTVAPRKWAHVACALYTNETFFVDPDAMEPIDGIAAVAARAQDRQDRCGLCGVKRGICSLCSVKACRAPFHISCGVSQGASFELRQSKQKVVGVRSFCPRHARTTPMDSAPSTGLKEGNMVSSTTSGATASATASGSISTASSMDHKEESPSRQNASCLDRCFGELPMQAKNVGTCVADLTNNGSGVIEKVTEDAGSGRPNGLRFTLKRRWEDSCAQVSEAGVSSDLQKKCGYGKRVTGDKVEAPGCKTMWHVVEPGQKLKKIKLKSGTPVQNQAPESSPTIFQQEEIECQAPEAEKVQEVMPAVGEASGDASGMFMNGLSEDRFAKELKELTILEQAMKSGLAPEYIMREAFVYWRAKRAGHKGFLLCELNHKQWSKSKSIFNKDSSEEGNRATGKSRVPLAHQPSTVSTDKMLEKSKELREQLERVRSMAQLVVQREKLKYNQQLVQMTIDSAELNGAESTSEERHCVWCPSTKTLLNCGTCRRSFCFNCFKNRKGFGVKGWMVASKQAMYSCKYCRELSSNVADLCNNSDAAPEEIVNVGLVSTPVVESELVHEIVGTPLINCEDSRRVREKEISNGRDEGRGLHGIDNSSPAPLRPVGSETIAVDKGLGIGRGKGSRWTASDNAGPGSVRHGSENGASYGCKPSELEDGLNKVLSIANDHMEHSSFETTLRRLKILGHKNKDDTQEQTVLSKIPSGDMAEETADKRTPGSVIHEVEPSTSNVGNVTVPVSPASGPALLVYKKKRRLMLSASSESPPSAYDISDEPDYSPYSSGLEKGTSERTMSPSSGVIAKRLEIGGLERM